MECQEGEELFDSIENRLEHIFRQKTELYEKSSSKAEYYQRGPSIFRHNAVFVAIA